MCALEFALAPLIPDSSTAEQSTVNRQVLGSNPSQGALNDVFTSVHDLYCLRMALFQLNVALPDRPGSLGLLASAIGAAGGDIRALAVVKAEDGRGYDDITVAIPGNDPTDLLNVLGAIGGVEVLSINPL